MKNGSQRLMRIGPGSKSGASFAYWILRWRRKGREAPLRRAGYLSGPTGLLRALHQTSQAMPHRDDRRGALWAESVISAMPKPMFEVVESPGGLRKTRPARLV